MDDESPAHEVELGAFAIGKYPVTIGEYMRFVEATRGHYPEWLKERVDYNDEISTAERYRSIGVNLENKNSPIVGISWKDAGAYCAWLSERTGEQYELPTEAEWEYACRAGSESDYFFGDNREELADYAWYLDNSEGYIHPIGQKKANDWGLHDMHGNVWEWVRDWYASYSEQRQIKPTGPARGSYRVIRGGSYSDADVDCRSVCREPENQDACRRSAGLRLSLGFRLSRRI